MRSAAPRGTNDLLLIRRLALQTAAAKGEKEKRVLMERAEASVFFPKAGVFRAQSAAFLCSFFFFPFKKKATIRFCLGQNRIVWHSMRHARFV